MNNFRFFKLFVFVVFFFSVFSFTFDNVLAAGIADDSDKKKKHTCIICSGDKETYKMEKQFRDRIKVIKSILGDSIDEIALAATVLHKEDSVEAVKSRYNENFDREKYRDDMTALFKGESSKDNDQKIGTDAGLSAGQVDLLNAAAIIMADSAGWTGKYNEKEYQKALAGDKLIGNNSDGFVSEVVNNVFCTLGRAGDGAFTAGNVLYQFATGQDVMTEIGRTATRWNNMGRICDNGYIGGVYNITNDTQPDENNRKLQKEAIADDIINLIHYYKLLVDYEEEEENCVSGVSGSIDGNTQAADLVGKSPEERIKILGPIAQAAYANTGVFASVTIAQAIKESSLGAAYEGSSFLNANNLLGVKCRTDECMNGFSVYKNIEESFMDRAKMFDGYSGYGNWRAASSPEELIRTILPVYCPVDDGCNTSEYMAQLMDWIRQYDLTKYDVKTKVATTSNSVSSWKQYEGDWKGLNVGNGGTMASIGCLVTASAIQLARSGTKITHLPSGYKAFDPGALVTALNNNNGFDGASLYWNKLSVVADNWKYVGQTDVNTSSNQVLANKVADELKTPASGKYQKFLILEISYGASKGTGNSSGEHWVAVNGVENGVVKILDPGASGTTLDENYSDWYVKGYAVMYATDVEFGKIGMSTDAGGDLCNVDLNYDFEAMLKLSKSLSMSNNSPKDDLAGSKFGSIEAFNSHIKQCVEQAGYGTRAGVVAAGKCLAYDYMEAVGKKYHYLLSGGNHRREGIEPTGGLHCSSFVWWAIYNGGFNTPKLQDRGSFSEAQARWALPLNITSYDYKNAQPGDFLLYSPLNGNWGHSRLIIGKTDEGLYIAEENAGNGAEISFSSFSKLSSRHYWVVNMSDFYANPANIRR